MNLDGSLEDVNLTVTCGPNITDSIISEASDGSRLPLFLQDQQRFGGTKELLESMQVIRLGFDRKLKFQILCGSNEITLSLVLVCVVS